MGIIPGITSLSLLLP